jgi:hypothetical protein
VNKGDTVVAGTEVIGEHITNKERYSAFKGVSNYFLPRNFRIFCYFGFDDTLGHGDNKEFYFDSNLFLRTRYLGAAIYDHDMTNQILSGTDIVNFEDTIVNFPSIMDIIGQANTNSSFYYSLFSSGAPGCPWLANGLYVDCNGIASACCMIKDVNAGFGKLTEENGDIIRERRAKMQEQLLGGEIPTPCKNCLTAKSVQKQCVSEK